MSGTSSGDAGAMITFTTGDPATALLAPANAPAAAAASESATTQPSFACSGATTTAEHLVCIDPELALADRGLDAVYRRALAGPQADGLVAQQREWLAKRNACQTAECVQHSYRSQLEAVFEAVEGESGLYRRTDRQGELTVIDVPGSKRGIAFRVTATYTGRSTNVGAATGVALLQGDRARFVANDYGQPCVLDLRRAGRFAWTVSTVDSAGCTLGHNVTLDGRYVIARR